MAVKPIVKFIRNSGGGSGNVDPQRLFGNLAQTNHYQVDFSSLSTFGGQGLLGYIKDKFGVNLDFISRNSGLLCSEASLPGTSLATAEVKDNFMGVSQEFAHTRLYTDFDFTFYVDSDYNNLRFFEGWIDFISSGSEIGDGGASPSQSNYYRRMRYPDSYKCQTISITKFEKNFGPRMTYSFMNAFPKLISAVPVSYGGADVLKVSVSFNYDRYVIGNNGFSKGFQGSFADPKQQSSELQQVQLNTFESLAGAPPAPVLPTRTEAATQLQQAAAEKLRLENLEKSKTESAEGADPFDTSLNYGIPIGSSRFFKASNNKTYRAENINGNIVIYRDTGPIGNVLDMKISSQDNLGSGNLWLWDDIKEVSEKGGFTGEDPTVVPDSAFEGEI